MEGLVLPVILVVIWCGLGLWGASIMGSKGRSTGAGFVFGVLLGPLGLVLAMLMSPSAEHLARRYAEHARGTQSPYGLRAAAGIGWYCERCGETFNDSQNAFASYERHECPERFSGLNSDVAPRKSSTVPSGIVYTGAPRAYLETEHRSVESPGLDPSDAEMAKRLVDENGLVCAGCDREFDDPLYLQPGHKTPPAEGGLNHISNRMLLCGPCNHIKSDKLTLNGLRAENRRRGRMA